MPLLGHRQARRAGRRKARLRRRFSRTLSRSRWGSYRTLLRIATTQGYAVQGLETWLAQDGASTLDAAPQLLLRHDVDQHPGAALRMASVEAEFDVHSSWYFRWRTAHPRVVAAVRDAGHDVGLHYETLTRLMLERRLPPERASELIPLARETLARELASFQDRFGPIRSVCPHGDTRVPGVHNGVLLRGQDLDQYGVTWDSNDAARGIDVWLTDRSRAEGSWRDGLDPIDLIIDRRSPLLLVVHPNNWVSGPSLWWDRLLPGGVRTGTDEPPPLVPRGSAAGSQRTDSPPAYSSAQNDGAVAGEAPDATRSHRC